MKEQYLVTVRIATYNSNLVYLSEAIDSAIMQTYRNIEIIICDDGLANIDEIESLIKNFIVYKMLSRFINSTSFQYFRK